MSPGSAALFPSPVHRFSVFRPVFTFFPAYMELRSQAIAGVRVCVLSRCQSVERGSTIFISFKKKMLLFMTGADYGSCQEQLKEGMLIERIAPSGDENEF